MNSSDLDDIKQQLKSLEARIAKIENHSITPVPDTQPQTVHPWACKYSTEATSSSEKSLEYSSMGGSSPGKWLGFVAIICFIFAAGFILKLSIQSGWLTPIRQVGLANILGMSLIVAGFFGLRSDKEYAAYLPAAGIVILYLAVGAAYWLYHLFSFEVVMGMLSLISLLCIGCYFEIRHDIYVFIATIGSYVAPLLFGPDVSAETFLLYYYVICSITFAFLSIWLRSRVLAILAAYLAIGMNALIGFDLHQDKLIVAVLIIHFFIFTIATGFYTQKNQSALTLNESWAFFPVLLMFYAAEYTFIHKINATTAPWISLCFAGILIAIFEWIKRQSISTVLNSQAMILAFASVVCFHSLYLNIIPADYRPWLFVVIMSGLAFVPSAFIIQKREANYSVPIIMLLLIMGIEYGNMFLHLQADYTPISWLLVSLASVASLWLFLLKQEHALQEKHYKYVPLFMAHILAVTALYQLTHDYNSLAVTASWLVYGIGVILLAFARRDAVMAKSALLVLAFVSGKALLYDVASAATVIRILCLLITGAALYGAGFLYRKMDKW